jgi:hypothetical protein
VGPLHRPMEYKAMMPPIIEFAEAERSPPLAA